MSGSSYELNSKVYTFMSFRLWTIFYVFALVAAAMATFGAWGIGMVIPILGFWALIFSKSISLKSGIVGVLVVGTFVFLNSTIVFPTIFRSYGRSYRNSCAFNLKCIALALLAYEAKNGKLPAAYVTDASGKRMHSWRVEILPYLERPDLFAAYNLDEPWDGPNNRRLAAEIPASFCCPGRWKHDYGRVFTTNYVALVDDKTVVSSYSGRALNTIADDRSQTIMLMEVDGLDIHWMEPRDVSIAEAIELLTTKPRSGHGVIRDSFFATRFYSSSNRHVAFCDGHTMFIGQLRDAEIARALMTAAGGEALPADLHELEQKPDESDGKTFVKWGRIWALSVFGVLSLLPVFWAPHEPPHNNRLRTREK